MHVSARANCEKARVRRGISLVHAQAFAPASMEFDGQMCDLVDYKKAIRWKR